MQFGQKIFLMSFALIVIAINAIGISMIKHTYESNMKKEIDKNILQINNIMSEVQNGIDNLSYVGNIYLKNNVHMEYFQEGKKVYTNFKEEYPRSRRKIINTRRQDDS